MLQHVRDPWSSHEHAKLQALITLPGNAAHFGGLEWAWDGIAAASYANKLQNLFHKDCAINERSSRASSFLMLRKSPLDRPRRSQGL